LQREPELSQPTEDDIHEYEVQIGTGSTGRRRDWRYRDLRLNAQTKPLAYLVTEIDVTDPAGYQTYVDRNTPIIAAAGGRWLVRGENVVALEGDGPAPKRLPSPYSTPWNKRGPIALQRPKRRSSRCATSRPNIMRSSPRAQ
jgi:hypothetical protein